MHNKSARDKNGELDLAQIEQQEQSEENEILAKAANQNSDGEPLNASQEMEVEGETQDLSTTEKTDGSTSQKQAELDKNAVSTEEAKQNSLAESVEGAAAETTTAGASKGAKKDDAGKG